MKPTVTVFTKDPYFAQKIRLELPDREIRITDKLPANDGAPMLADIRSSAFAPSGTHAPADADDLPENAVLFIRDGDIPPKDRPFIVDPFPAGSLKDILLALSDEQPLRLLAHDGSVVIRGRKIKLSENEFSLFSILWNSSKPVHRDVLAKAVWGENANNNLLNVYIHYLRSKLEIDGERIILSSRKDGYSISPAYRKEKLHAENHLM